MPKHSEAEIFRIESVLNNFKVHIAPLPGVENFRSSRVFAMQVIDSIRRVSYTAAVACRNISGRRADPNDLMFDPIKAAVLAMQRQDVNEACWLAFLFVHFGKHKLAGWRYIREVYGKLGAQPGWTWTLASQNPEGFRDWLRANQGHLLRGTNRGFGNHRKYQSMDADKPAGTGAAIVSYVSWIEQNGGHRQLFETAYGDGNNDDYEAFDYLYKSMSAVVSFGRTAKFDYLTMLTKLQITAIKPPRAYLGEATGPKAGAHLMLEGTVSGTMSIATLDAHLLTLANQLGVDMQVMEDSLCNWQKSHMSYRLFSG